MSDPYASADPAQAPPPSTDTDPSGAGSWPPPPAPVAHRRWRSVVGLIALGFLVIVLVAGIVADHWQVNYYVITPGQASPVSQYISVPAQYRHPLTGKILLTDVYVSQLNAFSYLQYRFFDSDSEIYPGGELFEGAPTQGQFLNQGYLQMAQAQNFATAAALTHLGYHVSSSNGGALIYGIPAKSPASGTLQVAQIIEAVEHEAHADGVRADRSPPRLHAGQHGDAAGGGLLHQQPGEFVPGKAVDKSVTLGTPPSGVSDPSCGGTPTAYLGVLAQTQQDWHFPVNVTINTPEIGGRRPGWP